MSSDTFSGNIKEIESTINNNWIISIIIIIVIICLFLIIFILIKRKNKKRSKTPVDITEQHTTIPIEQTYVAAEPINLPEKESAVQDTITDNTTDPDINSQAAPTESVLTDATEETDNSNTQQEVPYQTPDTQIETSPEIQDNPTTDTDNSQM